MSSGSLQLSWKRARRGLLRLALFFGVAALGQAAEAPHAREGEVKAAFLYNFTKFIDWPETAFAGRDSPFVIGVYGQEAFVREIETVVRGRSYNGRAFVVKALRSPAEAAGAHLIFLGSGEADAAELCRRVDGRPVLVVGDTADALRLGATIAFTFEGAKLRFALRLGAARRGALHVSAQLQKLAVSVTEGG